MQQSQDPVIIIGAGMAGLLAASVIQARSPSQPILILERSSAAGGHYREVMLEGFGRCDRAMRLLYETGIPEFDRILRDILPEAEWHILPGNEKDIAGIYWQGALQPHSPYIDLRRLPGSLLEQCESEIVPRLYGTAEEFAGDAQTYLRNRFGPVTAGYLTKALEKLHGVPASGLDVSATCQPAMNRVVLYGEEKMRRYIGDASACRLLAWPDQMTLPVRRTPPQCALYPRRFGMNRVIAALCAKLKKRKVRFLFNSAITSCSIQSGRITALKLSDGKVFTPSQVITTGGLQAVNDLLRGASAQAAPPFSWLVYLRVAQPPCMNRLYHFYCFDAPYATFRVTHYANYCPDARTPAGYPLCVELWNEDADEAQALAQAQAELRAMHIVAPDNVIVAQAALRAPNLHALCTVAYARYAQNLREELRQESPANLTACGPFIHDGVLLLYEVCRDMHPKLAALF